MSGVDDSQGATNQNGWRPDPALPERMRYWHDGAWTSHVTSGGVTYEEPFLGAGQVRWQYGVVNIGMYAAMNRMRQILAVAGEQGWELISVYDKASNWLNDMEKGFMLLKRPVPPGVRLDESDWCITISLPGHSPIRGR